MPISYPEGIDNSFTLPPVSGSGEVPTAVNAVRQAIIAIEEELGILPKGIYQDVRTRLDVLEQRMNTEGGGGGGGGGGIIDVVGSAPISVSGTLTKTVSIVAATTSLDGYLSAADKTKLDGITAGAAVASVGGTAPVVSTGGTTPVISMPLATSVVDGYMSAVAKAKLDGITAGAAVASVGATAPIVSTGGTTPNISIPLATALVDGYMSATNQAKLDRVSFDIAVIDDGDSPYTVTTERFIKADPVGGSVIVNLPASPLNGRQIDVKTTSVASVLNLITVDGNGHNIDGYSSVDLNVPYANLSIAYLNGEWAIL